MKLKLGVEEGERWVEYKYTKVFVLLFIYKYTKVLLLG